MNHYLNMSRTGMMMYVTNVIDCVLIELISYADVACEVMQTSHVL